MPAELRISLRFLRRLGLVIDFVGNLRIFGSTVLLDSSDELLEVSLRPVSELFGCQRPATSTTPNQIHKPRPPSIDQGLEFGQLGIRSFLVFAGATRVCRVLGIHASLDAYLFPVSQVFLVVEFGQAGRDEVVVPAVLIDETVNSV